MTARELGVGRGLTAAIGSGGKTTLLHRLAGELSAQGSVILTTTTHIRPSDVLPTLVSPSERALRDALASRRAVCVGSPAQDGKLAAPALPFSLLAALADFVLVEADGSRGLPLKAHAAHEPVVPEGCARVICVVGAAGLNRPIFEAVHRPALFCARVGTEPDDLATPERVAALLNAEALGDIYYVNQCDAPDALPNALRLAALLQKPAVFGADDPVDRSTSHPGGD